MWLLDSYQRPLLTSAGQPIFAENTVPITDPAAIKFSNESIRSGCDRLVTNYYLCDGVRDRWASLGGGQPALDVMKADIRKAADAFREAFGWTFDREALWFLGVNSLFPDTSEQVIDGSPADGRPINTGAKVNRVIDRFRQLNNYVRTANFDSFVSGDYPSATLNKILVACSDGPVAMLLSDAQNFVDVCIVLANRYEANTMAELNTLLALSERAVPD